MVTLVFVGGTVEVRGMPERSPELPDACLWDDRTACHRAPAIAYADVVRALVKAQIAYEDRARAYPTLDEGARVHREPRPYQREALEAWRRWRGRGVVVLPTGAGKTHVAMMAIDDRRRAALVVAPTLDLVRQWYDLLRATFGVTPGVVGGGEYDVRPLTVTTYDSAHLHMEHLGGRFGLVVFDECHHLPGAAYALSARLCLAPYRLGLTATPERADGREADLDELVGPIVYRKDIVDLAGDFLADYDTERISVELTAAEREEYAAARAVYRGFLEQNGIRMSSPTGWQDFIIRSSRSEEAGARWRPTAGSARSRSRRRRRWTSSSTCSRATATAARSSSRRTTPPATRSRGASSSPRSPTRRGCASAARSSSASATAATAPWSRRRCSTRASTSPPPTWRS
jgi:superfamily II DNA or RNA helicase